MRTIGELSKNKIVWLKAIWKDFDDLHVLLFGKRGQAEEFYAEATTGDIVLGHVTSTSNRDDGVRNSVRKAGLYVKGPIESTERMVGRAGIERIKHENNGKMWEWSLRLGDIYELSSRIKTSEVFPATVRTFARDRGGRIVSRLSGIELLEANKLEVKLWRKAPVEREVADIRRSLMEDESWRKTIYGAAKAAFERGTALPIFRRSKEGKGADDLTSLFLALQTALAERNCNCGICGMRIHPDEARKLFKLSVDRIVSQESGYTAANIQPCHVGCNYLKNDCSQSEARDFLRFLRNSNS